MLKRRLIPSALTILSLVSAGVHAANLPRPAHELTVDLTDGKKLLLSQYKGKVVAVCFILTTCSHCQKTVGFLTKLQKDYGPRGFQVLASAIEQDAASHVAGFLQQFNPSFPVGSNDGMTAIDWMQHPPMLSPHMPMLAFVDRQGNVRAQFEGDDEKFFGDQQEQNLRSQIEALLKDSAPAKKAPATSSAPKKQSPN
jgi:thiol-disulfide isomerase/thioredoxin